MKAVIGLGNPGPQYEKTRHNVGFRVVAQLAKRWGVAAFRQALGSLIGEAFWRGEAVLLVKPQAYMNCSGEAIGRLCNSYGLRAGDLVVVYDDMDLPLGRIRIRQNGGAGGHRGVQSVIAGLGTKEFSRVRIGIGRPPVGKNPADFLLSPFTWAEEEFISLAVERAAEAVETLLSEGLQKAMNQFNPPSQEGKI